MIKEQLEAIKQILRGLDGKITDPRAQKMLRFMLAAVTGLQLLIQYGGTLGL